MANKIIAKDKESKLSIMENDHGWSPGSKLARKYGLDAKKRYIYVLDQHLENARTIDTKKEVIEVAKISTPKVKAKVKAKKKKK